MKTSSYNLLPTTTFGTAVDNYDGTSSTFSGVAHKAAAYYSKDKSMQTLSWHLVGFVGILRVEATLDVIAESASYFPVVTLGDGVLPVDESSFTNVTGNYTWIRVTITDFSAGIINKVTVGY